MTARRSTQQRLIDANARIAELESQLDTTQATLDRYRDEVEQAGKAVLEQVREKRELGPSDKPLLERIYNDLLMRAELRNGVPVVALGSSVWRDLCEALGECDCPDCAPDNQEPPHD